MSILTDALRILGRFFGLRPGPDVEKLPEPKFKVGDRVWVESEQRYGTIERVHEPPNAPSGLPHCKFCGKRHAPGDHPQPKPEGKPS